METGELAPDFTLNNTDNENISLSDFRGDKKVLLLFFPLAFSSTCTKELCTTRDNMKLYEELNAEVMGISVDSHFTLREFKKSHNLNFTLLSDFNKQVSLRYEALYDDFYGMKGVSKRAAYVIGEDGTIQYAEVLDDAGALPDFEAIKKVLEP